MQTIDKSNGYIYELLKTFNQDYNCPLLINTSFNIKDEPIVDSPENAFKCFMSTEIDALVLENFIIENNYLICFLISKATFYSHRLIDVHRQAHNY